MEIASLEDDIDVDANYGQRWTSFDETRGQYCSVMIQPNFKTATSRKHLAVRLRESTGVSSSWNSESLVRESAMNGDKRNTLGLEESLIFRRVECSRNRAHRENTASANTVFSFAFRKMSCFIASDVGLQADWTVIRIPLKFEKTWLCTRTGEADSRSRVVKKMPDGTERMLEDRHDVLLKLAHWLYGADAEIFGLRFAPSPVCRSEAGLHGFSHPRFGVRAYVRSKRHGFLGFFNVRRMLELERQNVVWVTKPPLYSDFKGQKCFIADSLISVPERFRVPNYVFVNSSMSTEYSEPEFEGIPFMQAITLGGGLCAQACAWIGGAVAYEHALTLHGPSEVSCIAETANLNVDGPLEISINGLSFDKLGRYWEATELNGPLCFHEPDKENDMLQVLQAYVGSGFALIAAVDLGRLAGNRYGVGNGRLDSVYVKNEVPLELRPVLPSIVLHHAVTIVGSDLSGRTVLFNDSSSVPFLEVSVEDLLNRRTYGSEMTDAPNINELLVDSNLSGFFRFQPVLPKSISCHLDWTKRVNEEGHSVPIVGLSQLYDLLTENPDFVSLLQDTSIERLSAFADTEIRLVRGLNAKAIGNLRIQPRNSNAIEQFLARDPTHWYWIQRVETLGNHVNPYWLIWDAEMEIQQTLEDIEAARALLVAHVSDNPNQELVVHRLLPALFSVPAQIEPETKVPPVGKPRIVSSCFVVETVDGLDQVRKALVENGTFGESEPLPVEYYLAMMGDCEEFKDVGRNFVEIFANLYVSRRGELQRWAQKLALRLNKFNLAVEGFSTYIPEISSVDGSTRSDATNALLGAIETAKIFREVGHKVEFIELVGGTLFSGLGVKDEVKVGLGALPSYRYAILDARLRGIDRVANVIRDVIEKSGLFGIKLALELEPGPEYVLNSVSALESLFDRLPVVPEIGINVDIPHFRLAGESQQFVNRQYLWDRIVNTHVSSHGKAHLGEFSVQFLNSNDRSMLNRLRAFGMRESLEYEAAPSVASIVSSYLALL